MTYLSVTTSRDGITLSSFAESLETLNESSEDDEDKKEVRAVCWVFFFLSFINLKESLQFMETTNALIGKGVYLLTILQIWI